MRDYVETIIERTGSPIEHWLLEELVLVDLEWQWRSRAKNIAAQLDGQQCNRPILHGAQTVESYLCQFPALGNINNVSHSLVAEEYHTRQLWGDRPSILEYHQRFPHHWPELKKALQKMASEFANAQLSIYEASKPQVALPLTQTVELGRQTAGEPLPFASLDTTLGVRVIIASRHETSISRRQISFEPCGQEHVRISCLSRSVPVKFPEGESLRYPDQKIVRLPCMMSVGELVFRVE